MHPILKFFLAIIGGVIIGGIVNMALIILGPNIIPLPEGIDPMDEESLKAGMSSMKAVNFIFPFLAHAIGTLVGAFIAAKIAPNNKIIIGLVIGAIFLLGGIMMVMSVSGPIWFSVLDLVAAYLPMGYLGAKLASK